MDKLLALLPSNPHAEDKSLQVWQVRADGDVQASVMMLADIARARFAEVVAVVPMSQLSWHTVQLPVGLRMRGDARLVPVLQGLLEDVLLGDAAGAHIALQPRAQSGSGALAVVCDKTWLGGWLAAFEHAGVKLGRVLPQVPLESLEHTGVCTGRMHEAWMSAMVRGVPLTLPASIESAGILGVHLWQVQPAVFDDAALCVPEDQLSLLTDAQWSNQILASDWDLAQHEFASNPWERWRRKAKYFVQEFVHAPAWRASRWALLSLALVSVLGVNAKAWWSQQLLQDKQASIVQTVQQAFPHVRVVVDAPLQMQRELQLLRQSSGLLLASDLQPLLAAAGTALSGQSARPTAWEYSGTSLLLRGLKPDMAKEMNTKLAGTDYHVTVQGDALSLQVAN